MKPTSTAMTTYMETIVPAPVLGCIYDISTSSDSERRANHWCGMFDALESPRRIDIRRRRLCAPATGFKRVSSITAPMTVAVLPFFVNMSIDAVVCASTNKTGGGTVPVYFNECLLVRSRVRPP
jgi:hypothetical protein